MPTKAYFPRSHRYIDGSDRDPAATRPPTTATKDPRRGGPAARRGRSESVIGHAPPDAWAHAWGEEPDRETEAAPVRSPAPRRRKPTPNPASPTRSHPPQPTAVRLGDWLWACRVGAEADLCDELQTYGLTGQVVQPGLCVSQARPRTPQKEDAELTFARQGLPVQALAAADSATLAPLLLELLGSVPAQRGSGLALHVFAADSDAGNLLAAEVLALHARLAAALTAAGVTLHADGRTAHAEGGRLAQVCLLAVDEAAVGILPARAAPSLYPGGRQRFKKPKDAPARSALKLTEALAWIGHGPQAGEVCVDLGAAPGGWSQVLLERRCHVVAIDPGRLAPHLHGRLEHLRVNAFTFEPELPADWVLCDMAYRPLEVAALLAKWGRRRWAQFLLANIKLPMNRRVDMLARVREILTTGGWTGLRMRQLYHDRFEVTLTAWRGFGIDTRISRPPAGESVAGPGGPSAHGRPPRGDKGAAPARGRSGTRTAATPNKGSRNRPPADRSPKPGRSSKPSRNAKPGRDAKPGRGAPSRKPGRPRR